MAAKRGYREFFEVYRLSHGKDKSTPENKELPKETLNVNISNKVEINKHATGAKTSEPQRRKYELRSWIKRRGRIPDTNIKGRVPDVNASDAEPPQGKIKSLLKEEVRLSQEAIIIGAVAATFLSIVCFFVGYKVGHNKGAISNAENSSLIRNEQAINASRNDIIDDMDSLNLISESDEIESDISGLKRSADDLWTLRIISYKNTSPNLLKATNLAKAIKNMTGANSFVAKAGNELIVCVGKFKDDNDQKLIDLQIKMADLVYEDKKQFKACYPIKLK